MRHFLLHININFYIPFRAMLPVPSGRTGESGKIHKRHACKGSCACRSGHGHTGDESRCQCRETGHECRCRHEKEKR